jgi:hypothetical protein
MALYMLYSRLGETSAAHLFIVRVTDSLARIREASNLGIGAPGSLRSGCLCRKLLYSVRRMCIRNGVAVSAFWVSSKCNLRTGPRIESRATSARFFSLHGHLVQIDST